MVTGANLTSARGVLSLLDEKESDIQVFALKRLDELVDEFWAEISDSIELIESLYENQQFPRRELAALVASKVYYHLGSLKNSLLYALRAGEMFDVNTDSEYTITIISKCIDQYTDFKAKQYESSTEPVDSLLESVVNRMFDKCFIHGRYHQAAGIAFEARRIDIIRQAIEECRDKKQMLTYCLKVSLSLLNSKKFQHEVLQVLVEIYSNLPDPDYINICQCYIFLDEADACAQILEKLCNGTHEDFLVAYQISFDLYESATQHYLRRVTQCIKAALPPPSVPLEPPSSDKDGGPEQMEVDEQPVNPPKATEEKNDEIKNNEESENVSVEKASADDQNNASVPSDETKMEEQKEEEEKEVEEGWVTHLRCVAKVLSGERTVSLNQEFLIRNNHTDLQILKNTKEAGRNSITHNATIIANGFMHYGTTSDVFLRENLDWLKRASNWGKFTATASLGIIHYGHEKEALNLMSSYLPKDSSSGSPYAEGGGLFALGNSSAQ
jgi:26S proteasome regulatory subunit N2